MTEGAGGSSAPTRWGTAACLALGVLLLSAVDSLPLVLVPLALVMLTAALERRWSWIAAAAVLGVIGFGLAAGPMGEISRSWALLLGGAFVLVSMWRPSMPVLPRALLSVGIGGSAAALWLGLSGRWHTLDAMVREQLAQVSARSFAVARERADAPPWIEELAAAAGQVAELQAELFPALLALQSLAALGLTSWLVSRLRTGERTDFTVRPWREFRFNDQFVWLLIVGLALVVLPLGEGVMRVGVNVIVFMTALYALRGVGVFLFLSVGASSLLMIVFGAVAAIFLYPLILGAAILVGLGDTWLDVRGRAVAATRP